VKIALLIMVLFSISQLSFSDEYLLIKDGKVVNKIIADSAHAGAITSNHDFVKKAEVADKNVSVGWSYDNGILGVGASYTAPAAPAETAEQATLRSLRENKATLKSTIKGQCGAEPAGLLKDICLLVGG